VFDGRFRSSVDKRVGPIGAALGRTGLSPDHLTALGLVMAVPAAIAIGTGRLALGLVLLVTSAIPDLLDGALAKASGTASTRGAFFDSVADRVTDALILGGVAWYVQTAHRGHAAVLPFAILAVSMLVSYLRAKAESLGFSAKGGLMERAERIILLCVGLVAPVVLMPVLWAMLILTSVTAVQRFVKVWRQASQPVASKLAPVPRAQASPDATAAVAERWRAWRQQAAGRQRGDRVVFTARPPSGGHDGDPLTPANRWEERRAARLRANADDAGALRAQRRRHSTRRP
jgi:CDP-diacylglycerol--glycerol-3-phosphate 3-phosphatidyltransferase